jgi:hypothetical protein
MMQQLRSGNRAALAKAGKGLVRASQHPQTRSDGCREKRMDKPRVFLGSSSEQAKLLQALTSALISDGKSLADIGGVELLRIATRGPPNMSAERGAERARRTIAHALGNLRDSQGLPTQQSFSQ